jgi:hemerythrin
VERSAKQETAAMPLLVWNDSLDVNVKNMNDEHIELIRLMNRVHEASEGKRGNATVARELDELVNYTVKHFRDEEAYMDSIAFAGAASHKLIHKNLLERVGQYVAGFKRSGATHLPEDFFKFLRFWLVSHIQGIDTKYSAAAKPAKVASR